MQLPLQASGFAIRDLVAVLNKSCVVGFQGWRESPLARASFDARARVLALDALIAATRAARQNQLFSS